MDLTVSNVRISNCHILMQLALNLGYGRQISQGIKRFRAKRPDWIFHNRSLQSLIGVKTVTFDAAIGHFSDVEYKTALEQLGVPFYVNVSNRSPDVWCARVVSDDIAVGRMAADYFLNRGHRNFCCVQEPWSQFAVEREQGFRLQLKKAGIHEVAMWNLDEFNADHIQQGRLPVALFAMTDQSAVRVIGRLTDAGYSVPEDVAVLGVDDDDLASVISPVGLSSIRLPADRIGFTACELLEQMMNRGQLDTGVYRFAPLEVVERRSTGGRPVHDARMRRAQAFIEDHLSRLTSVDDVALGVGLSRRSLDRLFAEHLQVSPADWIALRRAERAENLLRETDYTVEYVAELVGFEDRRRLYRAFNKLKRPLPKDLRSKP